MSGPAGPPAQGVADLTPMVRRNEQRAWYWYDWANSAYYTTVLSVMFAPYMITVAGRAAGCDDPDEMRVLLDLGVDGLMTDRTDVLAAVLRERGLWPGTMAS